MTNSNDMTPQYALDWLLKLAIERANAHAGMPATQEALMTRAQQADAVLRAAITPKEVVSDRDSS